MKRILALALATALVIASQVLPSAAASRSVTVGDDFFKPTKLTVSKGTRVTWRWKGTELHNVTLKRAPRGVRHFHSSDKTSGTFSRTLRKAGTYRFECTIHGFTMKVVVS